MLKIFQKLYIKIAVFVLVIFLLPFVSRAATLSFNPSVGSLGPGNTFPLDILLDVEECVNAIEADIGFANDYLQLTDFIVGESILPLWVEKPDQEDIEKANKSGILNFIGGIPGGYCGKIPGDPGHSNTVARLIFEVSNQEINLEDKPNLDFLFLPSTKVLLNDGLGSFDNLTTKTANFDYSSEKVALSDDWSRKIDNDTIAPEPFIVELRQNSNMFDNQYYIIFNTIDKQSGLDHFEVLEIRPDQESGAVQGLNFWEKLKGKKVIVPEWKIAEIPYLLSDQSLVSIIRVKAIDKAGNERFVEYIPKEASKIIINNEGSWLIVSGLVLIGLIFVGLLIIFIRKIIITKKYDKE